MVEISSFTFGGVTIFAVVIGGVINKVVEYWWETRGKPAVKRIDQRLFDQVIVEQKKESVEHAEMAARLKALEEKVNKKRRK